MFKYACHKAGADYEAIKLIHPGALADIDKAFRDGVGQYVPAARPFPAAVGGRWDRARGNPIWTLIGPCGFSSIASTRDWLGSEMAKAFLRAYAKTRMYMNEAPAAEIARSQQPYFPDIDEAVLTKCIAAYKDLGTWTPHVEITKEAYEVILDVFEHFEP